MDLPLSDGTRKKVVIGHPDNSGEMKAMHKFRYDNYLRHGYVSADALPDGLDIDEYDSGKKCVYFVAQVDDRIIGCVRLILADPLPTIKDCFDFKEPEIIKKIPAKKRGEVSRLIVEDYGGGKHFPRHIIMLSLMSVLVDYCLGRNIVGGYGFIKDKLKKKLEKIKIPLVFIKDFKQKYDLPLLKGYFNDPNDPAWPIYYLAADAKRYFEMIESIIFRKENKTGEYFFLNFGFFKKIKLYLAINLFR